MSYFSNFNVTFFEEHLLKKTIKKIVSQGHQDQKITALYKLIRDAIEKEYYEDNQPTRVALMKEWFEASLE